MSPSATEDRRMPCRASTPHTSRSASTSVQNCTSAATAVPMRVWTSGRTSGHTSSRSQTWFTYARTKSGSCSSTLSCS